MSLCCIARAERFHSQRAPPTKGTSATAADSALKVGVAVVLATKPVKTATADPLAALPVGKPKAKGDGRAAVAGAGQSKITRDTGSE